MVEVKTYNHEFSLGRERTNAGVRIVNQVGDCSRQ
jgi:hypothetical protein